MGSDPVISHLQAEQMLAAHRSGAAELTVSLDLERSRQSLGLSGAGVLTPGALLIPWADIEGVASRPKGCFAWQGSRFEELYGLSEQTGWTYRLVPTAEAPALHLAGFTMHRMDGISPRQGALEMVHALGSPKGDVLDTATGLGYAAIGLAEQARRVVTIERDPAVRELCRWNPWSEDLFTIEHIELLLGDSAELIPDMADDAFGAILHDPPSMSLAGDLYGGPFYRQLYRILKPDGRLFHYIGDPKSAFGNSVTKGVIRRLGEAGFINIEAKTRAFGIVAHKAGRVLRVRHQRKGGR